MSSSEIDSFRIRFEYEFGRLLKTIDGLDDEAVNWKPAAPGANSLLVLVTHTLGSAEDHVVRVAAGMTVVRNRDAEFAAKGGTTHLASRAEEVRRRIGEALSTLEGRLDEERDVPFREWPAQKATVRDRLINSVAHTVEHVGHAQLTRDLLNARTAG
jgi:Protein of unknown function (DUF664)